LSSTNGTDFCTWVLFRQEYCITGQYSPQRFDKESKGGIITAVHVQQHSPGAEGLHDEDGGGHHTLRTAQITR
jgi:hypothetical protein